jgi:hypothetical protein
MMAKKKISFFVVKLRDLLNNSSIYDRHFKSKPEEWNALSITIDTLEDTYLALEHYETFGLGDEIGEKYLKLYGLLQAVVMHQDSICRLYQTFLGHDLQPDSGSAWMKIRDLSNSIKRCFISRFDLQSNKIRLWIWDKDKGIDEIEKVDLKNLFELYKSEAASYLNEIHQAQVENYGEL